MVEQAQEILAKLTDEQLGKAMLMWWGRPECEEKILQSIEGGFVDKATVKEFLSDLKKLN